MRIAVLLIVMGISQTFPAAAQTVCLGDIYKLGGQRCVALDEETVNAFDSMGLTVMPDVAVSVDVLLPVVAETANKTFAPCSSSDMPDQYQMLPMNDRGFDDLSDVISGIGGRDATMLQTLRNSVAAGIGIPADAAKGSAFFIPDMGLARDTADADLVLDRFDLGLLDGRGPMLMPTGEPGFEPSYPPCGSSSGGAAPRGPDVAACAHPATVNDALLEPSVASTQVRSVFVSAMGFGIEETDDGRPFIRKAPLCASGTVATAAHCSGFLLPGDSIVLTAFHCLKALSEGPAAVAVGQLQDGQSMACPAGTDIRVVLDRAVLHGGVPQDGEIRRCASIQRVSTDAATITLDDTFAVPPLVSSVSLSATPDLGTRLISQGYPQVPIPMKSTGGRLLPVRNCLTTLAFKLGYRPPVSSWDDLEIGGFGCASVDTTNGMSGAPIFAIGDASDSLRLLAIVSAAFEFDPNRECEALKTEIISEDCGTDSPDHNVVEFVQR